MSTLSFTKKAAEDLVKAYSTPDIIAQRQTVLDLLDVQKAESVLDVGCGPGFLCEEMAKRTGSEGRVLGIDISEDLLALSRNRNPPEHLSYANEDALALSAADGTYDAVACTQVAEYIPDTAALLAEIARVLRPKGRALIMATDWDCVAWRTENPERMKRVMTAWESHCAHPRLPRVLPQALRAAGLERIDVAMHPLLNLSFTRNDYSYGVAKLVRTYVQKAGIDAEEADAWFDELTRLNTAGHYYMATARVIFTAYKPG